MNLNDLAFVVNYIISQYAQLQIGEHYTTLTSHLSDVSSPQDKLQEKIQEAKDQLVRDHMSMSPKTWTYARTELFKQLGGEEKIAGGAAGTLTSIFSGYSTAEEVIKKVQALRSAVHTYVEEITKLKANLGTVGEYKQEETPNGKELLELSFDEDVKISTITDLQKQSHTWEVIFSNYLELVEAKDRGSIDIAYASKVNPFFLGLWVPPALARVVKLTLDPILDVRNKKLEGDLLVEQIREKKLNTYLEMKEKAPELLREETVASVTRSLLNEFSSKKLSKGEEKPNGELETRVKNNIEDTYDFITKGGKIDVASPKKGEDPKSSFQFAPVYTKMKQIETDTKNLLDVPKEEEIEPSVQAAPEDGEQE